MKAVFPSRLIDFALRAVTDVRREGRWEGVKGVRKLFAEAIRAQKAKAVL